MELSVETALNIDLPHGFFGREGGVSMGLYEGLNCGPGSNDDQTHIQLNREKVARYLSGHPATPVLSCYQIHGDTALFVDKDWGSNRPRADAMVTTTPGLILGVLTADCTPVLFADIENGVIGAAHAGWKGALYGIVQATVKLMIAKGAKLENITAATGPTIHQDSYEVGEDFRAVLLGNNLQHDHYLTSSKRDNHFQFDLPKFVLDQIRASGVKSVFQSPIDTYKSANHFSYRRTTHKREPDYGRQISAIMLPTP